MKTSKPSKKNAFNSELNISLASQSVSSHPFFFLYYYFGFASFSFNILSSSSHPSPSFLPPYHRISFISYLVVSQQLTTKLHRNSHLICVIHSAIYQILISDTTEVNSIYPVVIFEIVCACLCLKLMHSFSSTLFHPYHF